MISKDKAKSKLPFIEDKNLYQAVDLALWLILEKNRSFKSAVSIASSKRGYKVKAHIEKHIRDVIPPEFFLARQSQNAPPEAKAETASRMRAYANMEKQNKQHIDDITES
ncbi:hypothetical protein CKO50_01205 [Pseudoalteromonas sp. HM-SA03]|uniref:hypothetical protein n=1 Tax=Pseudoalteromonas sp. HM-SA03 TaxID=2029678 RepID=UPI000BAE1EDB|nr:hypothetical protein [Pseudoalteromonas sp. HM-SA03]PAY03173.1 hypothetical protein CKO50_01205 [Pseudoalteromonas sp. HM-SA03]